MLKYLIDTDVLIDYLRGSLQAEKFLEKIIAHNNCYISAMTIAELYAGVRDAEERPILEKFLQSFLIVDISPAIAQQGGLHRRDYGKSHGVGLGDAVIAASAESCNAQLVTLNKKHFPMLKNVTVPYLKGVIA